MNCNNEDLKAELYSNRAIAYFCLGKDFYISRVETVLFLLIQLFRARLSEKVHATIPKGIVGGFEFFVLQRNLKEWHERPWTCLRMLKESNDRRFNSYSARTAY